VTIFRSSVDEGTGRRTSEARYRAPTVTWVCAVSASALLGCSDGASRRQRTEPDGSATSPDGSATSPEAQSIEQPYGPGYALVGEDVFPPLVRRTSSEPCTAPFGDPGECVTDADCESGFACVCGGPPGLSDRNRCLAAECRTSADCGGGDCLLSLGSEPEGCCTFGALGFYCERSESSCRSGGDCPGNGVACLYAAATDRFECQPSSCTCGFTTDSK
jgi:hypothetical protein